LGNLREDKIERTGSRRCGERVRVIETERSRECRGESLAELSPYVWWGGWWWIWEVFGKNVGSPKNKKNKK